MTKEIRIFQDKERQNEIRGGITFDTVVAGESTTRAIYIENIMDYPVEIELRLEGDDIVISKTIKKILPKQTKEIRFVLSPRMTRMAPITAKLLMKMKYLMR